MAANIGFNPNVGIAALIYQAIIQKPRLCNYSMMQKMQCQE